MAAVRAQPVQSFATWGQIYYCVSKCLCVPLMRVHNKLYRNLNRQLNRSSRWKIGMESNPLFIIPDFFCIFPMNFAMATLGLKEMGKFLWECREKGLPCWLSHFIKTKLRQSTGQTFFLTFPKEFSHFLQT